MKKSLGLITAILSLLISNFSMAAPVDFSGGVRDELVYEEVIFITGEPIKFVGTVKATEKDKDDSSTASYTMKLAIHEDYKDKFKSAEFKKTVTYDTKYVKHSELGQTIATTTVGKTSETLVIDGVTFTSKDYQFYKSDTIDNRAIADFYSGDIKGKKHYTVTGNGLEGTVTVDISGRNSGYENFWGYTETQSLDNTITSNISSGEGAGGGESESIRTGKWIGTVNIKASDSLTKELMYSSNDVNHSSFEGGYAKVTNRESISKYNYDLPGGKGTIKLGLQNVPIPERLIVPKFRDVNGHWAEDSIKKLYSLDVFSGSESIFSPDTAMNRLDFTKAIVKSCDIRSSDDGKKKTKKNVKEESLFADIAISHPDYQYIKDAVEKKVVFGKRDNFGNEIFSPSDELTRAEAITILMRALGIENRAPNPGYITSFSDDSKIPGWAKDSIYMAREIKLIQGDTSNRVNSSKVLTRAESSTMLVNFLEFLERDLQEDYRENIINFN